MIKVMLIEDEPGIRKLLRKIIEKQEGFEVVAEASGFAEAVTQFTGCRPEVAFIDIDLAGESGMECARVLAELNPKLKIIFATAHSGYMADAFEIYAFDYIVKPFDIERVNRTLRRIMSGETADGEAAKDAASLASGEGSAHRSARAESERLMIKGREKTDFVDVDDIVFAEHVDGATDILTSGGQYRTSISLAELEQRLPSSQFMRSHKSYIINTDMITKVEPYGRWTYVVRFKTVEATALITAQKYDELKRMFGA